MQWGVLVSAALCNRPRQTAVADNSEELQILVLGWGGPTKAAPPPCPATPRLLVRPAQLHLLVPPLKPAAQSQHVPRSPA